MRTTAKKATVVVASLLTVASLGACSHNSDHKDSKDSDNPNDMKTTLSQAVDGYKDANSITIKFRTEADPSVIKTFLTEASKRSSTGGGVAASNPTANALLTSDSMAKAVAQSVLTVEEQAGQGKKLSEVKGDTPFSLGVFLDVEGGRVTDVLKLDKKILLRFDPKALGEKTGAWTGPQVDQLIASQVASNPWLKDAVGAKWLALDDTLSQKVISSFKNSAEKRTGATPSATPTGDKDKEKDTVVKDFLDNSTFSKDGDAIKASTDIKKASEKIITDLHALEPTVVTDQDVTKVKNQAAQFKDGSRFTSAWTVKDGKITMVKADLLQLLTNIDDSKASAEDKADKEAYKGKTLPVVVELKDSADDLKAPSDAKELKQSDLNSLGGAGTSDL